MARAPALISGLTFLSHRDVAKGYVGLVDLQIMPRAYPFPTELCGVTWAQESPKKEVQKATWRTES